SPNHSRRAGSEAGPAVAAPPPPGCRRDLARARGQRPVQRRPDRAPPGRRRHRGLSRRRGAPGHGTDADGPLSRAGGRRSPPRIAGRLPHAALVANSRAARLRRAVSERGGVSVDGVVLDADLEKLQWSRQRAADLFLELTRTGPSAPAETAPRRRPLLDDLIRSP